MKGVAGLSSDSDYFEICFITGDAVVPEISRGNIKVRFLPVSRDGRGAGFETSNGAGGSRVDCGLHGRVTG